jgi:competence protein ComEC
MQSSVAGAETMSAFLWSRDITHLDAVVLTHADVDNYNALPELIERFSISVVYVSPVMFEEESDALAALRWAVESAGVSIREIHAGERLRVPEPTRIEVLHPPRRGIIGSDNANSIVLRIDYADKRILLPGDLESPGLDDVLAEEPVGFDVVLTPHHGSVSNNPRGVAAWAKPDWAITSGGLGDRDRATAAAYEDVEAQVLHTATDGAVRVVIRNGEIKVRTWRGQPWCD